MWMDKNVDIKKRTKLLPGIRPEVDLMRSQHTDTKAVRALTTKAVRARHQPEKGRLYKIFNTSGVWGAWPCITAVRKKLIKKNQEYFNLHRAYTLEFAFTTFFGTDRTGQSWILPVGVEQKSTTLATLQYCKCKEMAKILIFTSQHAFD